MKIEWKNCFRLGLTVFLTFLAIHYWSSLTGVVKILLGAASSLLLGCIIAYVLNILMSFYEKNFFSKSKNKVVLKSKRVIWLVAALLTLIALVAFVIGLVVPELTGCVKLLVAEIPDTLKAGAKWLEDSGVFESSILNDYIGTLASINWQEKMAEVIRMLVAGVGGVTQAAVGAVSATISGVTRFVIGLIFAIYILLGKETLGRQIRKVMDHYLKPTWTKKIRYVVDVFHGSFHNFIVGQCIEAVVLGGLCMLGMMILRFPYAVMIGTLIGFTALIPVAGAYIGAGVGAFMILTVSPVKAVLFLVFIVVLQQLEGNLIYPKVVGSSIGLPGIWVLAAVTVGGGVMGISGMLLGVPTVAAVYQLVKQDLNRKPETVLPEDTDKKEKDS